MYIHNLFLFLSNLAVIISTEIFLYIWTEVKLYYQMTVFQMLMHRCAQTHGDFNTVNRSQFVRITAATI